MQYFDTHEDAIAIARAEDDARCSPLVKAIRRRVEELRAKLELSPIRSDNLLEDVGGIACELRGTRFALRLIETTRKELDARGEPFP